MANLDRTTQLLGSDGDGAAPAGESQGKSVHAPRPASKGGIDLMMKSLAQEVASRRIRVNSIAPAGGTRNG